MMHTQCLLYLSLMNGFFCSVESLSLFCTLEPKIGKRQHSHYLFHQQLKYYFYMSDILVIGVGDPGQQIDPKVIQYMKTKKISLGNL